MVDGGLKPINGTNITAVMTNVSSADNKVRRVEPRVAIDHDHDQIFELDCQ